MKRLLILLPLCLLMLARSVAAADHSLVTGMQTEHVDVTINFTGQDTLIFGALAKQGDVIIKVSSPDMNMDLSHKRAVGPFWLDGGKLTVRKTPGLYYLLSSKPLDEIVVADEEQKYGLHLHDALKHAEVDTTAAAAMGNWQDAFIDLKKAAGLFRKIPDAVKLQEKRLFIATIQLPANIPLGTYQLDIYLAQHGHIISHQTRHLDVNQVQLEHWIANAVNKHSWLFGVSFTIFAMALGLTFGMALRRSTAS
ncbi:MAG: hypothetical protein GC149_02660 [Gammaproteobacteria bacterium]|nr:hypothetical protein [Gammaproteobacteria bacterium]